MARHHVIKIRVTDEEKKSFQAIVERSTFTSVAALVRAMIPVAGTVHSTKAVDQKTAFQLAKIGNNLNQIARVANTYKAATPARQIVKQLQVIKDHLVHLEDTLC